MAYSIFPMQRTPFFPLATLLLAALPAGFVRGQAPAAPAVIDFEKLAVGEVPAEFMVIDGAWTIGDDGGNKVAQLQSEPVADGALLVGASIKGSGTVSAKVKAGKSRRAFPRFGVGLHGVSGTKVRVVPAQKAVELVQGENDIFATVPFDTWKEDAWWRIELTVNEKEGSWTAEARLWPDGEKRPELPQVTGKMPNAGAQGKASLIGTPYAGKPILFDDVTAATRQP